ncbi:hypothetical protein VNO78_21332 [Psophocarpus tetragonolobus]|uniref:Uncharacterized protein n=1 Tax=Psophocarpus tetragonolobus TaxID=3891 RepID=A0AAN9SBH9_PSOTE
MCCWLIVMAVEIDMTCLELCFPTVNEKLYVLFAAIASLSTKAKVSAKQEELGKRTSKISLNLLSYILEEAR